MIDLAVCQLGMNMDKIFTPKVLRHGAYKSLLEETYECDAEKLLGKC